MKTSVFKRHIQNGHFDIQSNELKSLIPDLCSFDCNKCGSYDSASNVCRACSLFIDFDYLDVHMPEFNPDYDDSDVFTNNVVSISKDEADKLLNFKNL